MNLAAQIIEICTKKNQTIASCESLTAGLFTSTIASNSGASAVLKGGLVTYFTELKEKLVKIDKKIVLEYGVVSEECASAMAVNTRTILDVDYCVSFTGNAGPSTMEGKPAGCVYCAIATKDAVYNYHFQCDDMTRNEVRTYVVDQMISHLYDLVK